MILSYADDNLYCVQLIQQHTNMMTNSHVNVKTQNKHELIHIVITSFKSSLRVRLKATHWHMQDIWHVMFSSAIPLMCGANPLRAKMQTDVHHA